MARKIPRDVNKVLKIIASNLPPAYRPAINYGFIEKETKASRDALRRASMADGAAPKIMSTQIVKVPAARNAPTPINHLKKLQQYFRSGGLEKAKAYADHVMQARKAYYEQKEFEQKTGVITKLVEELTKIKIK